MTLRAAARLATLVGGLAAGAGCAERGPLQPHENPAALTLAESQSWYRLGVQLLATSEPAQAERAFSRSLAIEGVTATTLTGLGIAAAQQGQLARARLHLERARELAPEDITVHNNLGVVLYQLGEYHAARQAFQVAFLLSSGRSDMAAQNMAKAETAIALNEAADTVDPALSHRVQRVGESEYRLLELDDAVTDGAGTGTPG